MAEEEATSRGDGLWRLWLAIGAQHDFRSHLDVEVETPALWRKSLPL